VGGELVGKRSENFCVSLSLKACILIWKRWLMNYEAMKEN
jgi:hypothetical protein